MTPKLQHLKLKAGLYFFIIAIACFVIGIAGMAWLYFTDYPADLYVPRSVTMSLLGSVMYGVIGFTILSHSSQCTNLAATWAKAKGQISVAEVGIISALVLVGLLNA